MPQSLCSRISGRYHCLYDQYILSNDILKIKNTSRYAFVSWSNNNGCIRLELFKNYALIFGEDILRTLGILKGKVYQGTICVSLFFFNICHSIFDSSYDIFIRYFLEVFEKLRPFLRRSGFPIWVDCLEEILTIHFFLSIMLPRSCIPLFLLIISLNFIIYLSCLFWLNQNFLIRILLNLFYKVEFLSEQ